MKKHWILILKLVIACITMLLLFTRLELSEIVAALRSPVNPLFIGMALFLLIPNLYLQWYRWHFLLSAVNPEVRISDSLGSLMGGMLMGFITPGRLGEVGRSLFLKNFDRWEAFGLAFFDKLYSLLVLLIGGIWGLTFFVVSRFGYDIFLMGPLFIVCVVLTVIVTAVALRPNWIRSFIYNLSLILPKRDKLKKLIGWVDSFDPSQAAKLFRLSILLYLLYILQFCLLVMSFEAIHLTIAAIATASTLFTKTLLPISLADIGIREGAAIYFFIHLGASKVAAFNGSILLFSINVLIPALIGFFFIPRLLIRPSQNK